MIETAASQTGSGAVAGCRNCGAPLTRTFVDLGLSPLANSYVRPEDADRPDPMYPLHAMVCDACLLVQLDWVVPADQIFNQHYAYFSSFSDSWLDHCRAFAGMAIDRFRLGADSLVVEIASNDGYLLQHFVERNVPVLGIEPAANVAAEAERRNVPTRVAFFGLALARTLRAEGLAPELICSANVLAHVPDIRDFVAGVATLLTGDAVYTVEFPHLMRLVAGLQFDTIYHEHYSYLSLTAIEHIFAAAGLRVFDVEELPTHGGSLRVYACLTGARHDEAPGVAAVRAKEEAAGLTTSSGYAGFGQRVAALRDELVAYLRSARGAGRRIAGYGAAAKGNTLLNYCGIGPDLIDMVVDRSPAKQGTLLPGSRIPVRLVEAMLQDPPDEVLILPWNIAPEIVDQLAALRARGVKFIIAVPTVTQVG